MVGIALPVELVEEDSSSIFYYQFGISLVGIAVLIGTGDSAFFQTRLVGGMANLQLSGIHAYLCPQLNEAGGIL